MSSSVGAGRLSDDQLRSFEEDGYLALDELLDDDDLKPIEEEYAALLDGVAASLHAAGRIPDPMRDLPFGERFSGLIAQYPELHRHFNISLPLINEAVDPQTFFMHSGPAVFELLRHRKILDVVESIIGPEIYSSPVQQMRMKPPVARVDEALKSHSNVGATTWHQDIVALLPEADDTEQLTIWLAITEATVKNGCLVSVPASHREGSKPHCINSAIASEPQVPGTLMAERNAVPLPVKRGGAILFHKMNIHRALPNNSNALRWSMDLRYHPTGQATGRPAFPGFIARSRIHPELEQRDPRAWAQSWNKARDNILSGRYQGRLFEDTRWHDAAVC